MFQPRLGIAYDIKGDGKQVIRANAGLYYARIPGLNLASGRSTDGSRGQTLFRNSALDAVFGARRPTTASCSRRRPAARSSPTCSCSTRTSRTRGRSPPRWATSASGARAWPRSLSYTHARTDHLTRFFNANDRCSARPRGPAASPGAERHRQLFVVQSTAKSRFNGVTAELRRTVDPHLQFQVNYTLSFDKSDDDNERDPFTFRYARADSLQARIQLERPRPAASVQRLGAGRAAGRLLPQQPGQRLLRAAGLGELRRGQPGHRRSGSSSQAQRICPDGHILQRNTIRRDNAYFSWDIRLSRPFNFGRQGTFEAIFEVFNVTNTDNFKDPSSGGTSTSTSTAPSGAASASRGSSRWAGGGCSRRKERRRTAARHARRRKGACLERMPPSLLAPGRLACPSRPSPSKRQRQHNPERPVPHVHVVQHRPQSRRVARLERQRRLRPAHLEPAAGDEADVELAERPAGRSRRRWRSDRGVGIRRSAGRSRSGARGPGRRTRRDGTAPAAAPARSSSGISI